MTRKEWEEQKRFITDAEALHLIKDGEYVHCFTNPANGMLLGADISRIRLIQILEQNSDKIELAGPAARAMKHGIAVPDGYHQLYIETDEERLNAFDPMPEE